MNKNIFVILIFAFFFNMEAMDAPAAIPTYTFIGVPVKKTDDIVAQMAGQEDNARTEYAARVNQPVEIRRNLITTYIPGLARIFAGVSGTEARNLLVFSVQQGSAVDGIMLQNLAAILERFPEIVAAHKKEIDELNKRYEDQRLNIELEYATHPDQRDLAWKKLDEEKMNVAKGVRSKYVAKIAALIGSVELINHNILELFNQLVIWDAHFDLLQGFGYYIARNIEFSQREYFETLLKLPVLAQLLLLRYSALKITAANWKQAIQWLTAIVQQPEARHFPELIQEIEESLAATTAENMYRLERDNSQFRDLLRQLSANFSAALKKTIIRLYREKCVTPVPFQGGNLLAIEVLNDHLIGVMTHEGIDNYLALINLETNQSKYIPLQSLQIPLPGLVRVFQCGNYYIVYQVRGVSSMLASDIKTDTLKSKTIEFEIQKAFAADNHTIIMRTRPPTLLATPYNVHILDIDNFESHPRLVKENIDEIYRIDNERILIQRTNIFEVWNWRTGLTERELAINELLKIPATSGVDFRNVLVRANTLYILATEFHFNAFGVKINANETILKIDLNSGSFQMYLKDLPLKILFGDVISQWEITPEWLVTHVLGLVNRANAPLEDRIKAINIHSQEVLTWIFTDRAQLLNAYSVILMHENKLYKMFLPEIATLEHILDYLLPARVEAPFELPVPISSETSLATVPAERPLKREKPEEEEEELQEPGDITIEDIEFEPAPKRLKPEPKT